MKSRGAWLAQLVKHLSLDLSSGLDLRVMSLSPALGSTLGLEPTERRKRERKKRKKGREGGREKEKKEKKRKEKRRKKTAQWH